MSKVVDFHPPLTRMEAIPDPADPEGYLVNVAMAIRLAKEAGTPQGSHFYRTYVAEWHSLDGQPLSDKKREEVAFRAAASKCGWKLQALN